MKKILLSITAALLSVTALAQSTYDQNKPFGFCTVSSRTDASSTYEVTGGGWSSYPVPDDFEGRVTVLTSDGPDADMKAKIQNGIKNNEILILDGSNGDFIVSSTVGCSFSNRTIIGINNARICTKWYVTDELKNALNEAGVPSMSTSSGGGRLPNGQNVSEEAEYNTRRIIIEMTGDNSESYRNSGILQLKGANNIIIRNITFQGPGSIDVGGSDLIASIDGAKNIWVDHCAFLDGMDGNFDITQKSDFHTVSWCIFRYTNRSYMHQNTNLIGSSDSESTGYLNTTFAFNWWATGCKQRMPMGRVGKIHMLNNYFSSTTASNCINPRKNSEFLIEGNYFAKGVKNFYSQSGAKAVTWADNNYSVETNQLGTPESFGSTVTVPYNYTVATTEDVPDAVQEYAGATLTFGGGDEPTGITGSIYWPMSSNTQASVGENIAEYINATEVTYGSNLNLRGNGTYGNVRFSLFQSQAIETAPADDNAVTFSLSPKGGYQFKATSIELYACKVATNNGNIDISWKDGGGTNLLVEGDSPNRNNQENNYYTSYNLKVKSVSTPTEGTCQLIINMYNVGAMKDGNLQMKDIGLAEVTIKGEIIDPTTGISTPVIMSVPMDNTYYNLKGLRVAQPTKGLYIVNGKKVMMK